MIIPSARVCKRSWNPKNIKWFLVPEIAKEVEIWKTVP
jgi:hypothetical protein